VVTSFSLTQGYTGTYDVQSAKKVFLTEGKVEKVFKASMRRKKKRKEKKGLLRER